MTISDKGRRAGEGEPTPDSQEAVVAPGPDRLLTELTYVETELSRILGALEALHTLPTMDEPEPLADSLHEAERAVHAAGEMAADYRASPEALVGSRDSEPSRKSAAHDSDEATTAAEKEAFDEPVSVETNIEGAALGDVVRNPDELVGAARKVTRESPAVESIDELVYYVDSMGAQVYHTDPGCHVLHSFVATPRNPIKIDIAGAEITRHTTDQVIDRECQYCQRTRERN